MYKIVDFVEWADMISSNIGADRVSDFIVFLSEVCCDNEQRLEIMRSLLEINESEREESR